MRINQTRLAIVYESLAKLPPFSRWKLLPSELITFKLTKDPDFYGRFTEGESAEPPLIEINPEMCDTFEEIVRTMAHEMIHLRQYLTGGIKPCRNGGHCKKFNRLARQVCEAFDWDLGTF